MITIEELMNLVERGDLVEHHSALKKGYTSRKSTGTVEAYKGRFGEGYKLTTPNHNSTRYSNLTYYIKKEVL